MINWIKEKYINFILSDNVKKYIRKNCPVCGKKLTIIHNIWEEYNPPFKCAIDEYCSQGYGSIKPSHYHMRIGIDYYNNKVINYIELWINEYRFHETFRSNYFIINKDIGIPELYTIYRSNKSPIDLSTITIPKIEKLLLLL